MTQSFYYTKELLFTEFDNAKDKDMKLSRKKSLLEKENDKHDNRIQFCKDHIELKKKRPELYEDVNVNFDNLLIAYQSKDPRDYFYKRILGRSFNEIHAEMGTDQ